MNNQTIKKDFSETNVSKKTVKLKRYKYKVKDTDGKIIESFFDAENNGIINQYVQYRVKKMVSETITDDMNDTNVNNDTNDMNVNTANNVRNDNNANNVRNENK